MLWFLSKVVSREKYFSADFRLSIFSLPGRNQARMTSERSQYVRHRPSAESDLGEVAVFLTILNYNLFSSKPTLSKFQWQSGNGVFSYGFSSLGMLIHSFLAPRRQGAKIAVILIQSGLAGIIPRCASAALRALIHSSRQDTKAQRLL